MYRTGNTAADGSLVVSPCSINVPSTRTYCWVAISVGYPLFTHAYYAQLPPHVVAMKYAVAINPTITGASSVGSLVAGGIGAFCDLRTFERHALAAMTVALNFRLALQAAALGGAAAYEFAASNCVYVAAGYACASLARMWMEERPSAATCTATASQRRL